MNRDFLRKNIGPLLALMIVGGTFALFALAFFLRVDGANEKVLFMVVGALASTLATVIGYYFGSSDGSAKKNQMIEKLGERNCSDGPDQSAG